METTSLYNMDNITSTESSPLWNITFPTNVTANKTATGSGLPPMGYYGELRKQFWKYCPPIIMTIGTIGNLLTIIVLIRQAKRLSSTALFLMALAFSDTVILWCGPLRNWIMTIEEIDVRYLSETSCKVQLFYTYVSIHFSSWMLVAVTMERVISVVLPHKVKLGFTTRNAAIIIFAVLIVICAIDTILPVMVTLKDTYRLNSKCSPRTKELLDFRDYYWNWIDFAVAFALPFLILLIGNIIIIAKLAESRRNKLKMQATRGGGGSGVGREASVSALLIFLSVLFFLTMSPPTVFGIYYPYRYQQLLKMPFKEGYYNYEKLMFGHVLVNLIGYTNAAFNFILYVFSGQKFRQELINLFLCRPAGKTSAFGVKTTSKSSSSTKNTEIRSHQVQQVPYETSEGFQQNNESNKKPFVKEVGNFDTNDKKHMNGVSESDTSSPVSVEDVKADLTMDEQP